MKISLFLTTLWLAFAALFAPAEKTLLIGKVTDEKGESLIGASVNILKNRESIKVAIVDAEGKYRIEIDPGTYDVEVAYTGYVTRRISDVKILEGTENSLDFVLEPGAILDETVVVGYGSARKSSDKPDGAAAHYSVDGIRATPAPEVTALERAVTGSVDKRYTGKKDAAEDVAKAKPATESKPVKTSEAPAPPPPPADYDMVEIDGVMKKVRIVFEPETYEEKVEIIDDETVVTPPPGSPTQPEPRAGLLTAGEWNDLHNWNQHWTDLLADGEIDQYQTMYGFFPKNRYTVLVTNEQGFPVSDIVVLLKSEGTIIWEARTDNTGKAELWASLFDIKDLPDLKIEVQTKDANHEIDRPKPAKDGFNFLKVNAECSSSQNVDIVWAVDATGSMGDEIEYLKTELLDVIGRAKSRNPSLAFRMGTVFYRDITDEYITKSSGLSPDISKTVDFIKQQYAGGGGDYPEAVHSALEEAIFNQKWSENAIARICFLVLDASPHQSPEVNSSLQKSIRAAARLGIRIVPVTASGIQKDTEFLMKFFGLATNGTYVFLTDHSGIGGKHLEPTSDEYKVEPLNELLVRLITEYTTIETCEGKSEIRFADDPQQQGQNWQAFYYPNPASTQFVLDLPFDVQSVVIYDSEGKAVRRLEKPHGGRHNVMVSDLSAGFYTIRILKDGKMQSGKLMVVRV